GELVAARARAARRAGDEREVLVRGGLIGEDRQPERQRRLELPRRVLVVAVLVAFHAALEVLLGAAFLARRGGRFARRGGPILGGRRDRRRGGTFCPPRGRPRRRRCLRPPRP